MDDPTINLTRRIEADCGLSVRPMPADDGRVSDADTADQAGSDDGRRDARVFGLRSFQCEKLACTISESTCARRHKQSQMSWNLYGSRRDKMKRTIMDMSPCRSCEIGKHNAAKTGV